MSCVGVLAARTFDRMTKGFVFAMWIFFALAAVSAIILRIRRPDLPRPYKCLGYPFVPIVFVIAAAARTVLAIADKPWDTLAWLVILAAGVPAYYWWRRIVPPPSPQAIEAELVNSNPETKEIQ